jgi:hypothetical protein
MRNVKCEINFTLNENPLSEIADGEGNVIGELKLSIPHAGIAADDLETHGSASLQMAISVYPNPAQEVLNIEFESYVEGVASLELVNMHGVTTIKRALGLTNAGWHKEAMDVRRLSPGVYFLKVEVNGEVSTKKVVITN